MSTGLHKDLPISEIHSPFSYLYVSAAARLAATGFVAGDVHKLALQTDDGSIWRLSDDSPITWVQVTGAGAVAGVDQDATCQPTDAVGDPVYISGPFASSKLVVTKADAADPTKAAIGLILSKSSATECKVRVIGLVSGLSGLIMNSVVYLAVGGGLTHTAPSATGQIVQELGIAAGPTEMVAEIKESVLRQG